MTTQPAPVSPAKAIVASVVVFLLFIGVVLGLWGTWKAFNRYQKRADANNTVKVTAIQIRNQAQRVKVAQQQAQIRLENARGIRAAQDAIAQTLTPLYVQYEMVRALETIARSGKNNSVVYIPSGANGIPLVSTVPQGQVGQPSEK